MQKKHTEPCDAMHQIFPYLTHHVEIPIFRKISVLFIILISMSTAISIYYFLSNWNFKLYVQNGFLHCLVIYTATILVNSLHMVKFHEKILNFRKELYSISPGPPLSEIIRRNYRTWRKARWIIAIICIAIAFMCIPISGDYREIYNILYMYDNWQENAILVTVVRYFTIVAKILLSHFIYTANFEYVAVFGDMTYGFSSLGDRLDKLSEKSDMGWALTTNEIYQKKVEETLKMLARKHALILQYASLVRRNMQLSIIMAYNIGVAFAAIFYCCISMNSNINAILKASVIICTLLFIVMSFSYIGQRLIDESNMLRKKLIDSPWIYWNKRNKKLYLIILMNCRDNIGIRSMSLVMSFELIVNFLKNTSSIMTAINRLASK